MQCVFDWTWFALGFELRWEHGSDTRLVVVTDRVWGGGRCAGVGVWVWFGIERGGVEGIVVTALVPFLVSPLPSSCDSVTISFSFSVPFLLR